MTQETAKKYTLTAHDIQAYLCELGIKPTEEVSIYSIEYYFDKLPVSTDELSIEKMQDELESCIQTLISVSILANGDENIVIGNFVDSRLSKLAKTHQNVTDYIERVTGKSIDVVLAENAALEAEEE